MTKVIILSPKSVNIQKNLRIGPPILGFYNDNIQGRENDGLFERSSRSSSSVMSSFSSAYRAIPRELHVPADSHPVRTRRAADSELNLNQTQQHESFFPNIYISRLLTHIYDAISLAFFLQSHKYTNRLARFAISVVFLISVVWYLIPALNTFSFYHFAGGLFFAKPQSNPFQQFGNHSCWFKEPSFGSRLAQVNEKLVNLADLALLEKIPLDIINTREKVAELSFYLKYTVKDPSPQVISHLSEYGSDSILTRGYVESFARMLGITILRVYSTTQSTIDDLKNISKAQKKQIYPAWVLTCILDNLLGESSFWINGLRCSTNLCASLLIKHIDWATLQIQGREEDALRLVKLFGNLRGHLKSVDEIQKQIQFERMMEVYQAHQNQTHDNDPHVWAKFMVFLESKIWPRIKALFVGKEPIITALETLPPQLNLPQLIIPFLKGGEEFFGQILSTLEELDIELYRLRQKAEEQNSWTALWCVSQRPPIRSWIKHLKSSFDVRVILPKEPEGQRKIGMAPGVENQD